jgi:hypothetical protein
MFFFYQYIALNASYVGKLIADVVKLNDRVAANHKVVHCLRGMLIFSLGALKRPAH